ncbi:hypothetical protein GCM10023322_05730 [Rugosimonospora acidiphila]|uniref:DUF1877 family protein n=2 Tax=Rugosimonospora acidiphila TaxID=556531 RepID=A0ABP9RKP3_9ACTN
MIIPVRPDPHVPRYLALGATIRAVPLIDYFIAVDDPTAATTIDVAGGPGVAGFETLLLKGIDPYITLGRLESILTSHSYDEITDDPRHCRPITDPEGDAFVVTVTDTLRDTLAAVGDDRLADLARRWAQTDELRLDGVDVSDLAETLTLLTALARRAVETDGHLYCRWAL